MKKITILKLITLGLAMSIFVLMYHVYQYQNRLTELLNYANELNATVIQQKENIYLPLKIGDYMIQEKLISQEFQNKIILVFPEDVCNICNERIFYDIKKIKKEEKKDIVTIVPLKFKRNFSIYNEEYSLGLNNVIYSSSFLDLSELVNNKLIIFYCSNKFQIMIPIILNSNNSHLEEYLLKINELKNNNS